MEENKEGFIKSFISSGLSPLQTSITDCLEQRKADVAGLYQPLNPSMNEIQQAITKCIEACLSEQKRGMEIGRKFISIKLLGYGCVSFNSFLETIITSQTPTSALSQQQESPWLSLDAVRFLVWRKDVYSEYSQLREYLSTMHIAERQGLDKSSIMLERLLKNYLNGKVE
ncbi:uncharacterized protein OCT59_026798 [Rhizophagus irregularis]|uniref:uncharacterized protein n=1 Tax=Rhizophagus irregularis TaxID=588596 RepID=UPI003328CF54|nr:hypothetical protein OCT59_026798 [Rhizophagus irregularis]